MTDPKMPPNVRVRELVWENVGRCIGWKAEDENTHLHTSLALDRFYQVAKGKDGWWVKWQGKYHAKGLPTLEAAKAAAQTDYQSRILSALEVADDDEADGLHRILKHAEDKWNSMSDMERKTAEVFLRSDTDTEPAALTKGSTDDRT